MKRIFALFLLLITVVAAFPAAVFADAGLGQAIAAKAAELEERYGVSIHYPMTSDGDASIALGSLETLDMALATVTPSVVRQVSRYYEEKLGNRLLFDYTLTRTGLEFGNTSVEAAYFKPGEGRIVLILPARSGSTVLTGDNPISIVHEFAHALFYMVTETAGTAGIRSDWTAMNHGAAYGAARSDESPDERVFVSGYAATSYEEDFAEVVGHCFIRTKAGQGFSNLLTANGGVTALGEKVAYVDRLLAAAFPDDAEMLANFRKALSAPTQTSYHGIVFSGAHLQFMGYPQPRYVLNGCLNVLGVTREEAIWIRGLGGWYVRDPGGSQIIVFPSLYWARLPANFVPPSA